jgi:hypothetical protein
LGTITKLAATLILLSALSLLFGPRKECWTGGLAGFLAAMERLTSSVK